MIILLDDEITDEEIRNAPLDSILICNWWGSLSITHVGPDAWIYSEREDDSTGTYEIVKKTTDSLIRNHNMDRLILLIPEPEKDKNATANKIV